MRTPRRSLPQVTTSASNSCCKLVRARCPGETNCGSEASAITDPHRTNLGG
jgi:hypothetical protein